MNLPVVIKFGREMANYTGNTELVFLLDDVSHKNLTTAETSSRVPACNSQHCYPSPSRRFGHFLAGSLFLSGTRRIMAQNAMVPRNGDSQTSDNLLYSASIKITKTRGRKTCNLNNWPLRPFYRSLLRGVLTMTCNALRQVPLLVLSRQKRPMAMLLQGRQLARARVRFVMMQAFAAKAATRNQNLNQTIAACGRRWFFVAKLTGRGPNFCV